MVNAEAVDLSPAAVAVAAVAVPFVSATAA